MGKQSSTEENGVKRWSTLDKSLNAEERNKLRLQIKNEFFKQETPRKEIQEKYNISRAQLHRISKEETAPKSKGKKSHLNEDQRLALLKAYQKEYGLSLQDFLEEKKPKRFFEFLIQRESTPTWKPSTNFLYPELKKFKELCSKLPHLNQNYTLSNTQSESNLTQNNNSNNYNSENNISTDENNIPTDETNIFTNESTLNNFNNGLIFNTVTSQNEVQPSFQLPSYCNEDQLPFSVATFLHHYDLQESQVSITPIQYVDTHYDETTVSQAFQLHHQSEFYDEEDSNQARRGDNSCQISTEDCPSNHSISQQLNSIPHLNQEEDDKYEIDYLSSNNSGEQLPYFFHS